MKKYFVMTLMGCSLFSCAMEEGRKDRLSSSFQRAAKELQEEEYKMHDGKVIKHKKSELEKELSKKPKKSQYKW